LAQIDASAFMVNWEYALLSRWFEQRKITHDQATKMISSTVAEILFDVAQAEGITEKTTQDGSLSASLIFVDVEETIARAELSWQLWQNAKLDRYSPNQAPVIRQADQLQKYTSPQSYQNLASLLNGENTLYDIALKTQRNVAEVAASLVRFVEMGWIEFTNIPDLPPPIYRGNLFNKTPAPALPPKKEALVACVDDSSSVLNTMEQLVTSADYQFLGIEDPVRAIGILLTRKPDLIFLDLVMPNGNGYEICEQLRKLSCFRNTPIVILTGNDGYASRLRSNFAGASDFLSKPLNANAVLSVIRKHLQQGVNHLSMATDR
jgi:chemotaxis family two-component system response regulator PixG